MCVEFHGRVEMLRPDGPNAFVRASTLYPNVLLLVTRAGDERSDDS